LCGYSSPSPLFPRQKDFPSTWAGSFHLPKLLNFIGGDVNRWGFTFPLGVYASCTTLIGEELASTAFKVLGTVSQF
jgi:hypothetical protein